ncbi:MAG: extracellular solute-binding protein [Treponema sp.]|nr:extracellular solute-binding protein [Treponema sp.]
MVTIKDIAKLAGVSHGTVSNVINHRGNVSSKKIRLVEDAARQLGYNTNAQAQKLRQEKSRLLVIILPDIEQRIYRVFYTSLKNMLEGQGYETALYLTDNSPETERLCVKQSLSGRPEYMVVVPCTDTAEVYKGINAKLILINHPLFQPQKNQVSLYFDFEAAAAAFEEKAAEKKYRNAAFFFDSLGVPAYRLFYGSLSRAFKARGIDLVPFFYNFRQIHHGAIAVLEHQPRFDLVITNTPFYAEKIKQVWELLSAEPPGTPAERKVFPAIMTFDMSETIPSPRGHGVSFYEFDYREMARTVFSAIPGELFGRSVPLKPKGFVPGLSPFETQKPGPGASGGGVSPGVETNELNMLTVASPTANILATLAPYFKRCTGIKLKVVTLPYEELFQLLSTGRISNLDLIRIDMAWGARFEKELYYPLGSLSKRLNFLAGTFLPSIKAGFSRADGELYSLPFDPSIQMLFYRQDLFENATIRRLFYEQTREHLEVPKTYKEFNRIAAFFSSALNERSPIPYGTTMVYGTAPVAACELLPRIKSMGGDSFDKSGGIRVTAPVFRKALEEYLELRDYSAPQVNYWWGDALSLFSQGLSAMTIVFINHVSGIIKASDTGLSLKVGAAPVPGNFPLLGGGSIGISRQSRNVDGCVEFFNWVFSDEIANMITLLGGFSPRESVFGNEEILELYPWLRNVGEQFKRGWRRVTSRRYPDFDNHRFERILGSAVRNAALGLATVTETLKNAQRQCEAEFGPGGKNGL